jgi:hypothetical protein
MLPYLNHSTYVKLDRIAIEIIIMIINLLVLLFTTIPAAHACKG